MAPTSVDVPIAIIGGGLGGLALAVGLTRHNIPFRIYEAAAEFSEIGAGIGTSTNTVRAIGLISPELLQGFQKHSTLNEFDSLRTTWFSFRYGQDSRNGDGKKSGDLIFNLEETPEWIERDRWLDTGSRSSIHRARLLEELVKLVPDGVTEFGKSLEHIENGSKTNTMLIHFSDGSTVRANAVVGADGIKSKAREYGESRASCVLISAHSTSMPKDNCAKFCRRVRISRSSTQRSSDCSAWTRTRDEWPNILRLRGIYRKLSYRKWISSERGRCSSKVGSTLR